MPRLVTQSRRLQGLANRKAARPTVGVMLVPRALSVEQWEAVAVPSQAALMAAGEERAAQLSPAPLPDLAAEAERNAAELTTGYSLTTGERHLMVNTPNGPTRFHAVRR